MAKNNIVKIGGELVSVDPDGIVADAAAVMDYTEGRNMTQKEINDDHSGKLDGPQGVVARVSALEEQVSFEGNFQVAATPADIAEGSGKIASANSVRGAIDVRTGYFECSTSGNVDNKEVIAPGYIQTVGGCIKVKMTNANTSNNLVSLQVGSTQQKPLYYDGEPVTAVNTWEAGEVVEVYYDGTSYYANNSSGGGKFKTGEKVKEVGIDTVPTPGSKDLVESGGVEKYLAREEVHVDSPTINTGYIKNDGTVNSNNQYGYVQPIELKDGQTILVNDGKQTYRPASGLALYETQSDGTFVRGLMGGGFQYVVYKNTSGSTMYVGFSAYNTGGATSSTKQCKYTISKIVEAAGKDSTDAAIAAETERAVAVEGKRLSVESQSLTDEQKAQALSNLGISGISNVPTKGSTDILESGGAHDYVRANTKILTMYGKSANSLILDSIASEGFLPNHRYRFTFLNYNEWTFPSGVSNSAVVLRVKGFNNKECITNDAENKFSTAVLNTLYYVNYTANNIPRSFEYVFPDHVVKIETVDEEPTEVEIPVEEWFVRIEGRAANAVLKIIAEDVTDTFDIEKERKLNESGDEWIEMAADENLPSLRVWDNSDPAVYKIKEDATNYCVSYYKAKKGDTIKIGIPSSGYVSLGVAITDSIPRAGVPSDVLLSSTSKATIRESVFNITRDCYVCIGYSTVGCWFNVKNTGISKKFSDIENEITDIKEGSGSNVVTDSCAYLDKQLLLNQNRGYYFDDTYNNETSSYDDSSYIDRKIQEVPEGKHFIFLTDSHYDYDAGVGVQQNAVPVIKYVRDRLGIKNVIFGGDAIGARPTKFSAAKVLSVYTKEMFESFGRDFLFVVGNHDTNAFEPAGGTLEDAMISDVEVYKRTTKVMKSYGEAVFPTKLIGIIEDSDDLQYRTSTDTLSDETKENFKAWSMMNYYYDDNSQKIRYIVLETGDCGKTMWDIFVNNGNDSQNSLLTVGYFFVEALKTVPQGYDVVVIGHWIINAGHFWKRVFYKTLALYKNKASGSVNFTPNGHSNVTPIVARTFDLKDSDPLTIAVDFTDSIGSGRVFCISGHTHYDRATIKKYVSESDSAEATPFPLTTNATPQSLVYTDGSILHIVCDRCCGIGQGSAYINGTVTECYSYPNNGTGVGEEVRIGTINEVLFDVVTLTPDNRVVLTRFGAEGKENGLPYVRDYVLPMASD